MNTEKHRVAIIGCGSMGQIYANVYKSFPNIEIIAIAERDPARRRHVGEWLGVTAMYPDAEALFGDLVPDIAAIITPTKYYMEAVIAAAEAGVKGVSTDKPLEATLANADRMVEICAARGVIFAGGALMGALPELQEAATWLREGRYGDLKGAAVLNWHGEISGSGCHAISILRLLTGAEVKEVVTWGSPKDVLSGNSDWGLSVSGRLRLSNDIDCLMFGQSIESGIVDVWTNDSLIRMPWGPPEIYQGFDPNGSRVKTKPSYRCLDWPSPRHLTGSIKSFIAAVETKDESELWVSGLDLRQALEVAIASQQSAKRGSVPITLPLKDRSLALFPRPYRWLGGDKYTEDGDMVVGHRTDMDI